MKKKTSAFSYHKADPAKQGKKCVVIYSGGKDGHLALAQAVEDKAVIQCLMTIDGGARHPAYFHDLRKVEILKVHAALMGIPLFIYKAPAGFSPKKGPAELVKILSKLGKKYSFKTIYSGASDYDEGGNAAQFKKVFKTAGFTTVAPFASKNVAELIKECELRGIKAVIVAVEKNVDKAWLGARLDKKFAAYIAKQAREGAGIDGNCFQTLVLESPLMKKRIEILKTSILAKKTTTFLKINKFALR